jgi:hypothetical protein
MAHVVEEEKNGKRESVPNYYKLNQKDNNTNLNLLSWIGDLSFYSSSDDEFIYEILIFSGLHRSLLRIAIVTILSVSLIKCWNTFFETFEINTSNFSTELL